MALTIYGPGGYNPAKPNGNVLQQWDDATRTVTDYRTTPPTVRPYTAAENAAADAELAAAAKATELADARRGIIEQALVRLAADAAEQTQRAAAIQAAIDAVDAQIAAVQGYTFTGTTVSTINASLNTALKPQLVSILTRQKQIGQLLAEMALWRAGTDRDLAWLARYVTST